MMFSRILKSKVSHGISKFDVQDVYVYFECDGASHYHAAVKSQVIDNIGLDDDIEKAVIKQVRNWFNLFVDHYNLYMIS